MLRPIVDVVPGVQLLEPDGGRLMVVGRRVWTEADGGRPWIKLHLRPPAGGEETVRQYLVTEDVVVDPFPAGGQMPAELFTREREEAYVLLEELGAGIQQDEDQPGRPVYEIDLGQTPAADEHVWALAPLAEVVRLSLDRTQVTDAALETVVGFQNLESLSLEETMVTDAGLLALQALPRLKRLVLTATEVTDAGLPYLAGIESLDEVWLDRTAVTDAGLPGLHPLPGLTRIAVFGTGVTPEGFARLAQAMPGLRPLKRKKRRS